MNKKLPDTLASRIQYLRESNNLTIEELSNKSNLTITEITDIEEGKEIFLSVTTRQKLSKALKVSATTLKEVEKDFVKNEISPEIIENIKKRILAGNLDNNFCPKCKNQLLCKIVILYDLEDKPVKHPKARCKQCPFQIK